MTGVRLATAVADVRRVAEPDAEMLTQLLPGEPAIVVAEADGWVEVRAPWQRSERHPDGYPGWVLESSLTEVDAEPAPPQPEEWSPAGLVRTAREYVGMPYVWGGLTRDGIDCSGLVHVAARAHGLLLPRDARDQVLALPAVDLDEVQVGDLYFFADSDEFGVTGRIDHVGWVTGPVGADGSRPMLHAPMDTRHVVDEPIPPHRLRRLVSAARPA